MTRDLRMRWLTPALALLLAVGLSACNSFTPNTIFGAHSEFGHSVDILTRRLLYLGIVVFVLVEALLLFILVKFRDKDGTREAQQIHGNTTLEIGWTLVPAVILAFIAVPTIETIFKTQAKAIPNALQVEVIGHQWWWEFRYPQFGVITANELYLPVGRTANFALTTKDVLHSFWVPQLNGKRDLISNHTNYIWFTPDSSFAWNGFCAEYCGTSHANMRFKVFTVTPAEFDAWVAHQKTNAAGSAPPPAPADSAKPAGAPAVLSVATSTGATTPAGQNAKPPVATPVMTVADTSSATYPRNKLPEWVVPKTPTPDGLTFDQSAEGDVSRGATLFKTAPCIACHTIKGVPTAAGIVGPNLTHVGSRTTIAGGIYPNDLKHLELWIKNAPAMKPGSLMPLFGKAEKGDTPGVYTDQQIADLAAYLSSLK
ncbi:MAG TPA: cytochrome c oxidase subunit II [Gemmatimonadaceae bacterium]|nr:cytochrome c oxidase subunit II [Gemmatimonadaceae bacterium]